MDEPPSDSAAPAPAEPAPASHVGWYRFALLITGQPEAAGQILQTAFLALGHRLDRLRTPAARRAWMAARIRKEAREVRTVSQEPWARIAALPEPGRTAYALYQALNDDLLDLKELQELAGCRSPSALAEALTAARRGLRPEAEFPSDSLLPLHCPWREDAPAVNTAVRATEGEALKAQIALDQEWRERLEGVALPEALELSTPAVHEQQALSRHPAMLAIAVAMVVMLGAVFFLAKERMDEFPGKELVSTLVEQYAEADQRELEPIERTPMEELGDWFLLKGFDGFLPPEELRKVEAEACRVFHHGDIVVAHLALVPRQVELFVFRSARLKPRVESSSWVRFQQDDWAVATRSEGGLTYVVALPGDQTDLPDFLRDGK